ncbi:hypothetical protein TeGR_g13585, partial [Tetraparma gracilis]
MHLLMNLLAPPYRDQLHSSGSAALAIPIASAPFLDPATSRYLVHLDCYPLTFEPPVVPLCVVLTESELRAYYPEHFRPSQISVTSSASTSTPASCSTLASCSGQTSAYRTKMITPFYVIVSSSRYGLKEGGLFPLGEVLSRDSEEPPITLPGREAPSPTMVPVRSLLEDNESVV